MANVLLGVTGSVAAIKTPQLFAELQRLGHAVKVVATGAALYFFDPATLDPSHTGRNPEVAILDADGMAGPRRRATLSAFRHGAAHRAAALGGRAGDRAAGREHSGKVGERPERQLPDLCLACVGRDAPDGAGPGDEHTDVATSRDAAQHLRQLALDAGTGAAVGAGSSTS